MDGRSMQLRWSHALASRRTIQDESLLVIASTANTEPGAAPFGVATYYPVQNVAVLRNLKRVSARPHKRRENA